MAKRNQPRVLEARSEPVRGDGHELNDTERFMLRRLQARDREVFATYIRPLQEQYADLMRAVEDRLGLPEGSINGEQYQIDNDTGRVVAAPPRTNGVQLG